MSDISEQRRYFERMIEEVGADYRKQIDQLKSENDKLRKLVGICTEYCVNGYCDDDCPLSEGPFKCNLIERAEELGVEV